MGRQQVSEYGPIYGVKLIGSLPIGDGAWSQAMPTREDLIKSRKFGDRLAAGYEVLLARYCELKKQQQTERGDASE